MSDFGSIYSSRSSSPIPTIYDRENLIQPVEFKVTGFTPRPLEKLVITKRAKTSVDLDVQHHLRIRNMNNPYIRKELPYLMWLEAGKIPGPAPLKLDPQFNNNNWRNFNRTYSVSGSLDNGKINSIIADMYPVNIPAASKMGNNSLSKFLRDMPIFQEERMRDIAIKRTSEEVQQFKRLRLRSEARFPPLDESGRIIPPLNYKRYVSKFIAPPPVTTKPPDQKDGVYENDIPEPPQNMRIDIFGQEVPVLENAGPRLYKLSYKLNNPQFKHIQDEIAKRRRALSHQPVFPI